MTNNKNKKRRTSTTKQPGTTYDPVAGLWVYTETSSSSSSDCSTGSSSSTYDSGSSSTSSYDGGSSASVDCGGGGF